jgi:transcriptional regulator with XRE-family HTH domain
MSRKKDPVDSYVGALIKRLRKQRGVSQEALGEALGVTFQQIQKYENGINRVAAGRLQRIAKALDVPIEYFFEGSPENAAGHDEGRRVLRGPGKDEYAELIAVFRGIKNRAARQKLIALAKELAKHSR